jgi:N-acetylglucosaminyl-diphospho-decaprenol L-rhamnosyltransferase
MTEPTPCFDVVVVAYASRDTIGHCIEQVGDLAGVGNLVVVDHGTDGTADIAETLGVRVFRNPGNPGFGAGQNRGVAATSAPYVLLLNPDAAPEPDGIAAGLMLLDADPRVGAVQGVITNRMTGAPERSSGRELGPVHLLGRAVGARRLLAYAPVRAVARRVGVVADHVERVPTGPTAVDSLAATAILVRRTAFDQIGGFDESYFLYGEDLDLCRRMRCAGWTLVAMPDRFAWHESGASAASTTERELTWWRGTMRFAALWWTEAAWYTALLSATIAWLDLSVRDLRVSTRAWRELVVEPQRDRRRRG